MPTLRPTPTSYAVLGLLSLRSWTTYELVQQADRSLRWFFPRADRAVYLEAKRLVRLGWANAETVVTGRRPATRYAVTDAGRAAMRAWLATDTSPAPQVESEGAMKVFFADLATTDDLRAVIADLRLQADGALDQLAALAQEALGGRTPFPDRRPTTSLALRFVADIHAAIRDWTLWADSAASVLDGSDPDEIGTQTVEALEQVAGRGTRQSQKRRSP